MPDQPNLAQPPTFPDTPDISPMPVTDTPPTPTPPPTPSDDVSNIPPMIAGSSSPKRKSGRILATILGILLLVGAVGTGVILVGQKQLFEQKAGFEKCPKIAPPRCTECTPNVDDSTGCIIGYECASCPPTQPTQPPCTYFPELPPGGMASLCPGEGCKTISIIDSAGCLSGYRCECPPDPCEGRSCLKIVPPTCNEGCTVDYDIDDCGCAINVACKCPPEPTEPPTPTSTPGETAVYQNIKAYDISWNQLTAAQLNSLKAGDHVRFTVSGTPINKIDKAKFTINGVERAETTNKKPSTEEYYDEYTVPVGTMSFTVNAKLHHLTIGWF